MYRLSGRPTVAAANSRAPVAWDLRFNVLESHLYLRFCLLLALETYSGGYKIIYDICRFSEKAISGQPGCYCANKSLLRWLRSRFLEGSAVVTDRTTM